MGSFLSDKLWGNLLAETALPYTKAHTPIGLRQIYGYLNCTWQNPIWRKRREVKREWASERSKWITNFSDHATTIGSAARTDTSIVVVKRLFLERKQKRLLPRPAQGSLPVHVHVVDRRRRVELSPHRLVRHPYIRAIIRDHTPSLCVPPAHCRES